MNRQESEQLLAAFLLDEVATGMAQIGPSIFGSNQFLDPRGQGITIPGTEQTTGFPVGYEFLVTTDVRSQHHSHERHRSRHALLLLQ